MGILNSTSFKVIQFHLVLLASGLVNTTSTCNEFETLSEQKIKLEYTYFQGGSLSLLHCASYCAKNISCNSASYNELDGSCRLSMYRVNAENSDEKFIYGSPWTIVYKHENFEGWTQIGEGYYIFSDEGKNYSDAKIYCEKIGGKLAEPPTETVFELLRAYMIEQYGDQAFWFGLHDVDEDGLYDWASCDDYPSYTAFCPKLDYSVIEYAGWCMFMSGSCEFLWSNEPCDFVKFAICEKL